MRPTTVCGVIAVVDGTGTGMCMPDAGFPLVNDLPTNNVSQSAPIDGVLPVNACSIVVAVAGSASNQCEPTHLATNPTGSVPVNVPVTVCAVTAALDGNADGTCTGCQHRHDRPDRHAGQPRHGRHAPDHHLRDRGWRSAARPAPPARSPR